MNHLAEAEVQALMVKFLRYLNPTAECEHRQ